MSFPDPVAVTFAGHHERVQVGASSYGLPPNTRVAEFDVDGPVALILNIGGDVHLLAEGGEIPLTQAQRILFAWGMFSARARRYD
jgi:hypothetical protein